MKKKLLSLILIMIMIAGLIPFGIIGASAADYSGTCGTNLTWTLDTNTGVLEISGTGAMTNYSGNNMPWHSQSYAIRSVTVGSNVTSIGHYAFQDCNMLTSITIPDSVVSIGHDAFYSCASLESITIPDSVMSIGSYAFYGCNALTTATIGVNSQIKRINEGVFQGCNSLKEITLPDSVELIETYAFAECSDLISVNIEKSSKLKIIGVEAFVGCEGLTSITIPKEVRLIGGYAFGGCTSLETVYYNATDASYDFDNYGVGFLCDSDSEASVIIGNSVKNIPSGLFWGCYGITAVTFEGSSQLEAIGNYAFFDCTSLEDITIPDTVTSIGEDAFYGVEWLDNQTDKFVIVGNGILVKYNGEDTDITIPDNVTSIIDGVFYDRTNLETVTFGENSQLKTVGNSAFNGTPWFENQTDEFVVAGKTLIKYNGNDANIIIPNIVASIGSGTFANCESLVNVTFEENSQLETIGRRAFEACTNLKSIIIPDSVVSIGSSAFNGCQALTTATIGVNSQIKRINEGVFQGCNSLKEITLPDSVELIETYAFAECSGLIKVNIGESSKLARIGMGSFFGCISLTSITIPEGVMLIGGGAFNGCTALETVYYNAEDAGCDYYSYGSVEIGSSEVETSVIIGNSVKNIPYGLFWGCNGITAVTFEESSLIAAIGDLTFFGCSRLESITIPESVTSIGERAFESCTELENITIPASVTSIGDEAFFGDSSLTTVNFGENSQLKEIGNNAFSGCLGLESITIPESVTSIGNRAFFNCTNLTSINIPERVTSIGDSAFYGCSGLESITIPERVTSIGDSAFYNCSGLTSLTFEGNSQLETIGNSAFSGCSGLESITIPASVTSIGNRAFFGCDNLEICGIVGSYAQSYAEENEIPFIGLYTVTYYINGVQDGEQEKYLLGEDVTIREDPTKEGYTFSGWDRTITERPDENVEIHGTFIINKYRVTFVDYDGTIIQVIDGKNSQAVEHGNAAAAPIDPIREGYIFTGWSGDFTSVKKNLTLIAQYSEIEPEPEPERYTVVFVFYDGETLKMVTQVVEEGSPATAPNNTARTGYTFDGWDSEAYTNVTENITVTAVYTETEENQSNPTGPKVPEGPDGIDDFEDQDTQETPQKLSTIQLFFQMILQWLKRIFKF